MNFQDERTAETLVKHTAPQAAGRERLMKWQQDGVPVLVFVASTPSDSPPWGSLGDIEQVVYKGPSTFDISAILYTTGSLLGIVNSGT